MNIEELVKEHKKWLQQERQEPVTDFIGGNFNKATLGRTDFERANMTDAIFSVANLRNSNFTEAILKFANFGGSNLTGANFKGADCQGVNFKECKLTGANFTNARLVNADFRHAKLKGANFTGANLNGCIGDGIYIKSIFWSPDYPVSYTHDTVYVGCASFPYKFWQRIKPSDVRKLDTDNPDKAEKFWTDYRDVLEVVILGNRPLPFNEE